MVQAPVSPLMRAQDVPLDQIKATLLNMWHELNELSRSEQRKEVVRSSVMTLVAYAQGKEQAAHISAVIDGLTGQHPSRAIILASEPTASLDAPRAELTLRTHALDSGTGVVGAEQIILTLPGQPRQLAQYAMPLLLSDMPIFVWWTGGLPARDDLVNSLVEIGDYSIFDSADFDTPEHDIVRLSDLIQKRRNHQVNHTAFNDFNWTRIKPWRELTAQCFDPPRQRPHLDAIEQVTIEYAMADRPNPQQAILFAGWLASRLGWQFRSSRRRSSGKVAIELSSFTSAAPIVLEIVPRMGVKTHDWREASGVELLRQQMEISGIHQLPAAEMEPSVSLGAICRVALKTGLEGKVATFEIVRDDDLKNARTLITLPDEPPMDPHHSPLESLSEVALLRQQLTFFNYDHIYEDSVLASREMVQSSDV